MFQIVALEKRNEDHVQRRGKKTYAVASEDDSGEEQADPPFKADADD